MNEGDSARGVSLGAVNPCGRALPGLVPTVVSALGQGLARKGALEKLTVEEQEDMSRLWTDANCQCSEVLRKTLGGQAGLGGGWEE